MSFSSPTTSQPASMKRRTDSKPIRPPDPVTIAVGMVRQTSETMGGTTPCRVPLACGALGRYDRTRVERMVSLLGGGLRVAHEDRDSILMLDRPALEWHGPQE